MNEAPGLAQVSLERSLTISGIVSVLMLLAIPVSALLPGGQIVGQFLTILWAASLIFVAVGARRISRGGRSTRLIVTTAGVVGMGVIALGELVSIVGLSTPAAVAPFTTPALVLSGLWLVAISRLAVTAGFLPVRVGLVGVASGVASAVTYPLLLIGGFPTTTDPSALSSMSPVTIVAAMLSLLSIPLYAVWAIWAARRLPRAA